MKAEREILLFLMYAFVIPLVCIFITNRGSLIVFAIQGASPFLAAIVVTVQYNGFSGLRKFIREKYRHNFHFNYIIMAILIPTIILTMAKVTTYAVGYNTSVLSIPTGKKIGIILWALVAEELGWRGYLQDKLQCIVNREYHIPLITGIIWALWHYQFYLLGTMDSPIVLFGFGCVAESYGYYTITKLSGGNIVPASIWHLVGNLLFNLYLFSPDWNGNSLVPFAVANLFYSINIVFFIWYMGRGNKESTNSRMIHISGGNKKC